MTDYTFSVVMIVPGAVRNAATQLGQALGFDGGFAVELEDGQGATFWGLHTWATQAFIDLLTGPSPAVEGFAPEQIEGLRSTFILSIDASGAQAPTEHFAATLAANGLSRVAFAGPLG